MFNLKENEIQLRAHRESGHIAIGLYGWQQKNGVLARASAIVLEEVTRENECLYHPPIAHLNEHTAQVLMDSLWECGIRPTEGTGSAGAMAATERHLKDLQQIAFDLLRNKLKTKGPA